MDYTWGRRVRMSEGDSMPSRPRDPARRKIVSAFERTGFQASHVIIKPAAGSIGLEGGGVSMALKAMGGAGIP